MLQDGLKTGGTVIAFSWLLRDGNGVHASWEIETTMDWPAFSEWVRGRVPPGFRTDGSHGTWLGLRKSTEGDFYMLRLEPIAATAPPRVRAAFEGRPN